MSRKCKNEETQSRKSTRARMLSQDELRVWYVATQGMCKVYENAGFFQEDTKLGPLERNPQNRRGTTEQEVGSYDMPPKEGKIYEKNLALPREIRKRFHYTHSLKKVDLHGLTIEQAFTTLLATLKNSYLQEERYMLIIAGKAQRKPCEDRHFTSGPSTLRACFATWAAHAPEIRRWIMGTEIASPHHGGEGAFYVFLKKKPKDRKVRGNFSFTINPKENGNEY